MSREHAGIKTLSFYEMKPLPGLGLPVVEAGDADPGVPLTGNYPLDEDHNTICKPDSKGSPIYREVLSFVRDECFQIPDSLPVPTEGRQGEPPSADEAPSGAPPWPPSEEGEDIPRTSKPLIPLVGTAVTLVAGILLFKTLFGGPAPDGSPPREGSRVAPGSRPEPVGPPNKGKEGPPEVASEAAVDEAVLGGDVRDAVTREPLAGVVLTLQNYDDKHGRTPECRTDRNGRFRFDNLPPSTQPVQRVRVVAWREGYEVSDTFTSLGTRSESIKLRPLAGKKD